MFFQNDYACGVNNFRTQILPETIERSGDTNRKILMEVFDNYYKLYLGRYIKSSRDIFYNNAGIVIIN